LTVFAPCTNQAEVFDSIILQRKWSQDYRFRNKEDAILESKQTKAATFVYCLTLVLGAPLMAAEVETKKELRSEIKLDRKEIRSDKKELRSDRKEWRQDKKDIREARKEGASKETLQKMRSETKQDKKEIAQDKKELKSDRRELRSDRKDFSKAK
jgi:hypothetical protein